MNWKYMRDEDEKYNAYLCSREWAVLRKGVLKRTNGLCERCHKNKISQVHHLTYNRKYNERLEDLQGLCKGCHAFTHGHSDRDPCNQNDSETLAIMTKEFNKVVKTSELEIERQKKHIERLKKQIERLKERYVRAQESTKNKIERLKESRDRAWRIAYPRCVPTPHAANDMEQLESKVRISMLSDTDESISEDIISACAGWECDKPLQ